MAGRGRHSPIPSESSSGLSESSELAAQNLSRLRTHWKWAAFSQFFYTFLPLFAMEDVSLSDIENDLARQSNVFLPRVMARLLHVLAYNPKVSLHNWQAALRKQHNRRDPASNPIGPEPGPDDNPAPAPTDDTIMEANGRGSEKSVPEMRLRDRTTAPAAQQENAPLEEPKDWLGLPMLTKLDSIHLMTKWHFQNPKRLRSLKSDDEGDPTSVSDP
ncbi:hypothetical protein B0H10DRAFT_1957566 [Mycena sp. CBHHK59/15]|nr:hypothetical protein B0H10DRAFT_1957566 [Mycena sp. CBHHK59/15]